MWGIRLLLLGSFLSLYACGSNEDSAHPKIQDSADSVGEPTLVDPAWLYAAAARPFIKIPPYQDYAVDRASDARSCQAAGGDWGDIYELGSLHGPNNFSDEEWGDTPKEARKPVGKTCWSRPIYYSDGGKSCRDQSDCEMNCIAARDAEGRFGSPQCQASNWHQPNCETIVVQGQLFDVGCRIP